MTTPQRLAFISEKISLLNDITRLVEQDLSKVVLTNLEKDFLLNIQIALNKAQGNVEALRETIRDLEK